MLSLANNSDFLCLNIVSRNLTFFAPKLIYHPHMMFLNGSTMVLLIDV